MTAHPREKAFKRFGETLDLVYVQLNQGMSWVERLDQSGSEQEREIFATLAAVQVHNSWHTVTRLLRSIARDVDHDVPRGAGATKQLLEQMMQRTNERPGILNQRHREMVQKLVAFHREFRSAKGTHRSRREVTDLMEFMSDEIVPDILENIRLLALASPGGVNLLTHLRPKSNEPVAAPYEEPRRAQSQNP